MELGFRSKPLRRAFGRALLGCSLLPSCASPVSPVGTSTAVGAALCADVAGSAAERVDRCIGALRPHPRSARFGEAVRDVSAAGRWFVVGSDPAFGSAPSWSSSTELHAPLLGTDEEAAAAALRSGQIRGIAVPRALVAALDRDATVLARLAQHDALDWFQLRYVEADWLLYTVRSSPARVAESTGAAIIDGLRARLEGRTPTPQRWAPDQVRLMAGIRLQGQVLVFRHAVGSNLDTVLDELASKLRRRWEREVETRGVGRLDDRLRDARIEVHVVLERARVEPRDRAFLSDLWELGIDGVMFRPEDERQESFAFLPGSEAVARSFRTADDFLQHAADVHEWRARRPWEASDIRLDLLRGEQFMEAHAGGGSVVRMRRGLREVSVDEVTDENLRSMLVDGAEWWLANQHDDGSFTYKYWPDQNRVSDDYNEVRHILGARDLTDAWRYRPDRRYVDGARRAMDWLAQFEVGPDSPAHPRLPQPPEGTSLFRYPLVDGRKPANQKLGTVAVALLAWVSHARVTGSHAEDERIRRFARFTKSMLDDSGRFEPYFVLPGHPYVGHRNDIVPGEAALALGVVAEYFGEPDWVDFFPRFLDHYEPWFRERAARKRPTGRWPESTYDGQTRLDLVQFGPWAVMAARTYHRITGDPRAATFGLEIADWMIDHYQWTSERAPWPDYVGGYYKMKEELPAMQSFCYSEGTAAAYMLATRFRPSSKAKYERATRETLRFLQQMQYDDVDAYFAARPEAVRGGVKYALNETKVRTDYVGHALSTVSQFLDARAADPDAGFLLPPLVVEDAPVRTSQTLPVAEPTPEEPEVDD